jgi:O-antigen/teichoic acid export membrane protein
LERSVKTARNAIFNVAGFLYPAMLAIVITPVYLHYIGTAAYGIYALAIAFVSILGLLEFGAGLALMKYMPEHIARGENEAAVEIMRAGLAFYGLLALVGASAAGVVGMFFIHSLFSVPPELASSARLAFVLGGVAFALTVLMNVFGSVLGSLQRFDIATKISVAATSSATAVSVILLVVGLGLNGVMIGVVFRPALGLVLYARAAQLRLPEVRFTPKWNGNLLRPLVALSAYIFIGNISGVVLFQFDKFYLGVVSGVALVTFYVVPGALASRLHAAAGSITSVALPTASELFSRGDLFRVQVLYRRASWLTALFLVSVGTPAVLFSANILDHWVGLTFEKKSTEALQILIATYAILGVSAIAYWITMAAGRPKSTVVFNLASASINVGAIFLLVPSYGIVGAAVAYLVSVITVPGFIWYVERRVLQLARSPWRGIAWRLTIGVISQVVVCLALRPFAENLLSTIALVLLCILVAPAVLYGFGFIEADDKALLRRVLGRQPVGGAAR